jgi:hypothetical protein
MSLHCSTHKVFKSHVKSSQTDFLYYSVLVDPIRSEHTAYGSRCIAAERTWTYSKGISRDRYPANLLARRSDLQKTSFFYYCVLDCVYRAVAWQRVDQIRYIMFKDQ